MTINDVRVRVLAIATVARHDDEAAHALEDELHRDVLRAIATGLGGDALAQVALETLAIEFVRHCA